MILHRSEEYRLGLIGSCIRMILELSCCHTFVLKKSVHRITDPLLPRLVVNYRWILQKGLQVKGTSCDLSLEVKFVLLAEKEL